MIQQNFHNISISLKSSNAQWSLEKWEISIRYPASISSTSQHTACPKKIIHFLLTHQQTWTSSIHLVSLNLSKFSDASMMMMPFKCYLMIVPPKAKGFKNNISYIQLRSWDIHEIKIRYWGEIMQKTELFKKTACIILDKNVNPNIDLCSPQPQMNSIKILSLLTVFSSILAPFWIRISTMPRCSICTARYNGVYKMNNVKEDFHQPYSSQQHTAYHKQRCQSIPINISVLFWSILSLNLQKCSSRIFGIKKLLMKFCPLFSLNIFFS